MKKGEVGNFGGPLTSISFCLRTGFEWAEKRHQAMKCGKKDRGQGGPQEAAG